MMERSPTSRPSWPILAALTGMLGGACVPSSPGTPKVAQKYTGWVYRQVSHTKKSGTLGHDRTPKKRAAAAYTERLQVCPGCLLEPSGELLCLFALAYGHPVKRPGADLNHGDAAMNCSVERFGSLLTGCLDETANLVTAFIDPILQELDALLVLSLKIVVMCFYDCFGSHPVHLIVDIHEEWHEPSVLRCGGSLSETPGLYADPIIRRRIRTP